MKKRSIVRQKITMIVDKLDTMESYTVTTPGPTMVKDLEHLIESLSKFNFDMATLYDSSL